MHFSIEGVESHGSNLTTVRASLRVQRGPAGRRIAVVALEPGQATLQGNPTESVMNVQGSVHGGWFASILDGAVGNAIHTMLPAGTGYTTLDLSVKMTRAIVPAPGIRVRAIGKIIQVGRQVATAEGRIVGPDGKLYAHATTTCLILSHAKK